MLGLYSMKSWCYLVSTRDRRLLGVVFIFIYYVSNEKEKEAFSVEVQSDG